MTSEAGVPVLTPADLKIMVRKDGFVNIFWRYLASQRRLRPWLTMEQAYDELDDMYFDEYGAHQWPSYDAFRHARNKYQG